MLSRTKIVRENREKEEGVPSPMYNTYKFVLLGEFHCVRLYLRKWHTQRVFLVKFEGQGDEKYFMGATKQSQSGRIIVIYHLIIEWTKLRVFFALRKRINFTTCSFDRHEEISEAQFEDQNSGFRTCIALP